MPDYLPGAEPFFFPGNSTGCLLIHGFGGTPYEMRGLGEYLSQQFGYTVSGPVLAGHATHITHLARTEWRDWYNSADEAYRELRVKTERVIVAGLSMGGVLALHLAAHRSLDAVVAVSAPAYVNHPWTGHFRRFPILFRLVPFIQSRPADDDTQDPTVKEKHPTYDQTSTSAARSLILGLIPHMRAHLPKIRQPVLLIQGRQDRTIPSDSMPILYSELGSAERQMLWVEPSGHLVLEDYAHEQAFRAIDQFIQEHIPQSRPAVS